MAETLPLLASYLLKALPIGNRSGCSKNRGSKLHLDSCFGKRQRRVTRLECTVISLMMRRCRPIFSLRPTPHPRTAAPPPLEASR